MISIQEHINLKEHTTIQLGGSARYFCLCSSIEEIKESIVFARSRSLQFLILGGGSNMIFPDNGFDGLIIKIDLKGTSYREDGESVIANVQAGEHWDEFVLHSIERGYSGIECLSGIPGSVGATPIQNVGAYGQEVKDTIHSIKVIEIESLQEQEIPNVECNFSYRMSRFKSYNANKFIITEVVYLLGKNGRPTIHYPELQRMVDASVNLSALADGKESLMAVRNIVMSLRSKKSMIIDPKDPNSRSVGSFFLNPIVDQSTISKIEKIWSKIGDKTPVPSFPFGQKKKIPAAWLIENSGFQKGYQRNGVGISEHHTLALVNFNGTTKALMELMQEIQAGVEKVFDIQLSPEANIII